MPDLGKVLFINPAHPILSDALEGMGFQCDFQTEAPKEDLAERLADYSGIVIRSRFQLDRAFLERGTQLRFIARYGVGLEHIDLEYAAHQNIPVFNSPEGSKDTVAEHALGMILNLMNHIGRADREIRAGLWNREPNRGTELMGKTIGILGYGNLGQAFARRLTGLGVKTIAYDKYKSGYGDEFAEEVDLAGLHRESDILSIHIPYETANHYFIDGAFIDAFQKPIYLINTARGLVLHTGDLVKRLVAGKVIGAGIDVIEYEEGSFAHLTIDELPEPFQQLRKANNVILTPHIAGWSHMAKKRHAEVLAGKIRKLVAIDQH